MKIIDVKRLKERWVQFKHWQSHAFDYDFDKNELHRCVNCENTYSGNYCPHCSQKTGVGKITWKSVLQGTLDVWGMGSRSLPYTLLQLMFRPGHMISEYINGKRQVSFPPVKMLVIMGVLSVIIDQIFVLPDVLTKDVNIVNAGRLQFIEEYIVWLEANPGWGWLSISNFFLIPTWIIFRYSPKNNKHLIPQGFFIQVFLSMMVMVIDDLADMSSDFLYIMVPLSYMYVNRQLFGHSYWGTIWRTLLVMLCGIILLIICLYIIDIYKSSSSFISHDIMTIVYLLLICNAIMFAGAAISWRSMKLRPIQHNEK